MAGSAHIATLLSLRMQLVGRLSSQSHVPGSLGAAPHNAQAIHPSIHPSIHPTVRRPPPPPTLPPMHRRRCHRGIGKCIGLSCSGC